MVALKSVLNNRGSGIKAKKALHDGVIVIGGRVRGRPRLGWMDGVKVALGSRGMTVKAARQRATEREWGAMTHM